MLQPVELQDVSSRYTESIADLRTFLSHASVRVGTAQAAHDVATRLTTDRAFHRDLMSHVWVMLDESGLTLRYADLLAIMTIAAAGMPNAAAIDEDDAHTLLRFLMEAKHTLQGTQTQSGPIVPRETLATGALGMQDMAERRRMPSRSGEAVARTVPAPAPVPLPAESKFTRVQTREPEPPATKRRGLLYAAVALCTAVVLLIGYVILRRPDTMTGDGAVAIKSSVAQERPAPGAVFTTDSAVTSPSGAGTGRADADTLSPNSQRPQPAGRWPAVAKSDLPAAPAYSGSAGVTATAPPPSAAPIVRVLPGTTSAMPPAIAAGSVPAVTAVPAGNSALPIAKQTRPSSFVPTPVAADALTARLDSPRMPAYASEPDETKGRKYPRLLRRHSGGSLTEGAPDANLSAELRAPDLSGASASSRGQAPATPHGLVHSTSIGMMAGNLVYGPTPSYPAAAVSAHVQGEVKIQATIDRDGSVNAARVISGPPLLRDAALDAVQHWRYKPYTEGGKPAPTGTMAVVSFELP